MKWTLLAAAALVLCCGLPFRTHETRTLLPVQTVQAERTEAGVRIVTEAGEGSGATWDDAVAALRMAARSRASLCTQCAMIVPRFQRPNFA